MIGLLAAAATFLADLLRAVTIPCHVDFISVSGCGDGDGIEIEKDVAMDLCGRHVILVDDTIDTGLTLQYVVKRLLERAPASLAVCTLLDRPHRRIAQHGNQVQGLRGPRRIRRGLWARLPRTL